MQDSTPDAFYNLLRYISSMHMSPISRHESLGKHIREQQQCCNH